MKLDYETGEIFNLKPEYTSMSRRPGIGREWFDQYKNDVYSSSKDYVIIRGRKMRPPKFYDQIMKDLDPDLMDDIVERRLDNFVPTDNTPERLKVRHEVTKSRLAQYSRDVV